MTPVRMQGYWPQHRYRVASLLGRALMWLLRDELQRLEKRVELRANDFTATVLEDHEQSKHPARRRVIGCGRTPKAQRRAA